MQAMNSVSAVPGDASAANSRGVRLGVVAAGLAVAVGAVGAAVVVLPLLEPGERVTYSLFSLVTF